MNVANRFAAPDYEARIEEFARRALDDIEPCASAEYKVRWIAGAAVLTVGFPILSSPHLPAVFIRLVTISRSEPLKPGQLLEPGDRLRRHIRDSVETYLAKHGIRLPTEG